jgi:hypothetical protein
MTIHTHFNDMLTASPSLNIDITAIELTSNQPTVATQSLSGRTQVRSFGGHYWSARIVMPPLSQEKLRRIYAFLIQQKGSLTSFTISPTNLANVSGTQTNNEGIASTGSIGNNTITMDNSNEFKPGDMINFSGHSKAYMVIEHSGATLTFEPALVSAVADTENVLSKDNFKLTVRLSGDTVRYFEGADGFASLEFDVVEAI